MQEMKKISLRINWPNVMQAYLAALFVTALSLCAVAAPRGIGNPYAVLGLCFVAALAERGRVRLGVRVEASISLLPTVFAAAVFGPLAGALVAASSFLGDFPLLLGGERRSETGEQRTPLLKWAVYTCVRAIYGAAAGFAASWTASLVSGDVTRLVVATVTAAVVAESLDVAFAALTLKLRRGDVGAFMRAFVPILVATVSFYTPVVALLSIAYSDVSPWTIAFFFLPALAAQRLFALYQEQRQLADKLLDANAELENANLSFAAALITTLDARDQYTAGHSAAVAIYARDIARRMGLNEAEQAKAYLCGLVHDIGKVGLQAGLLEKPGALSLEERREMERHSEIGWRILTNVQSYADVAAAVRHHHERFDGTGYPDGLAAAEIPLLGRIIAVADAYNAMTSDRPYRDAMPTRVARLRLAQAVEAQFDTAVVAAFEAVLAGANEDYRVARSPEFRFDPGQQSNRSTAEAPNAFAVSA
jgi:putative nucleotidyltransferase with HDIG domain